MIKLVKGNYIAECDGGCGTKLNTGQRSIQQAANYLSRAENWDNLEHGGIWRHYCPRCTEGGLPDPDLEHVGIGFTQRGIPDDE